MNERLNSKKLDTIMHELMDSINASKGKAFYFYESVLNGLKELREEKDRVDSGIIKLEKEIEETRALSKKYRKNLLIVTKKIKKNPDKCQFEYMETYKKNENLISKIQKIEKEYVEKFKRRDYLERKIEYLEELSVDSRRLVQSISTSLNCFNTDLLSLSETLNEKELILLTVVESAERERMRISRDIHDGPAQLLASLMFEVQILESAIQNKDSEEIEYSIKNIKDRVNMTSRDMRRVIYDLRPMSLDDLGLIPTIKNYIEEFNGSKEIKTKLKLIDNNNLVDNLPEALNIVIFRVVQESFFNAYKYSNGTCISITLEVIKGKVALTIKDNGKGFNVSEELEKAKKNKEKKFGIIGMRERIGIVGGKMNIVSNKKGTEVKAWIPSNMVIYSN